MSFILLTYQVSILCLKTPSMLTKVHFSSMYVSKSLIWPFKKGKLQRQFVTVTVIISNPSKLT